MLPARDVIGKHILTLSNKIHDPLAPQYAKFDLSYDYNYSLKSTLSLLYEAVMQPEFEVSISQDSKLSIMLDIGNAGETKKGTFEMRHWQNEMNWKSREYIRRQLTDDDIRALIFAFFTIRHQTHYSFRLLDLRTVIENYNLFLKRKWSASDIKP